MKKLLLLLVAVMALSSCMHDESPTQFYMEFVPVENVVLPESVSIGNVYEIKVNYSRPTSCHLFQGFLYEEEGNQVTVAVQTIYLIDGNCQQYTAGQQAEQAKFNFECRPDYTINKYVFKFYRGQNTDGTDDFLVYEVPVVQ